MQMSDKSCQFDSRVTYIIRPVSVMPTIQSLPVVCQRLLIVNHWFCLVFVMCLFLIRLLSRIFQRTPTRMALYSLIVLMCR